MRWLLLMVVGLFFLTSCTPQQIFYIYSPPQQQPTQPFIEQPTQVIPQGEVEIGEDHINQRDPCYVDPKLFMIKSVTPSISGYATYDGLGTRKKAAKYFAEHIACLFERHQYKGLYYTFTPKLQSLRSLTSFVGIMQHRWRRDMAPDAVRVEKLEYFEGGNVAHLFLTAQYPEGGLRKVPHVVLRFIDDRWYMDDFYEVFLKECYVHSDCMNPRECRNKCERIGLYAESKCDPIISECSCYCAGDEREKHDINFFDLNEYVN